MIDESFFDGGELRLIRRTGRKCEGKDCLAWQGWFNDQQYASGSSPAVVMEELARQVLAHAEAARDFRRQLDKEAQAEFERIKELFEESLR